MSNPPLNVLFLCTGNSARSIMAEALVTTMGRGQFQGYSAGSNPNGIVNPFAIEQVKKTGYSTDNLRSKRWDEFAAPGAPHMDFIITVCDNAAGEVCPIWPGHPASAHWGFEDPAAVEGSDEEKRAAFERIFKQIMARIHAFVSLPHHLLEKHAIHHEIQKNRHDACRGLMAEMGRFERYLTLWVGLCIAAGVTLGKLFPSVFQAIAQMEVAQVNLPVGLLIWVMIIPMLVKIDFSALSQVKSQWRGMGVTLVINWLVKPFSMAFLGWLFIRYLFAGWLPAEQIDSYIAGLILLAAAPCTAMVFVWSQLCKGDPYFTLSQVALNDAIMMVAFAPLVALLLGMASITVPWDTLITSVGLYIIVPVMLAQMIRKVLVSQGPDTLERTTKQLAPFSMMALLLTLVLLFAFQGEALTEQPLVIGILAIPILIQVFLNSGLAYVLNRKLGVPHCVAGPSSLIGASNFFELSVATAISLFGFQSGAALATVVGVLIEVPVMLLVVGIVNRSQSWYESGITHSRS